MAKRVKATVNPTVLVWARESAGYTLPMAADKLRLDLDLIAAWETGDEQPSIPQLRRLADTYKRPLAVMYLPEPPLLFQPMHDFRRLPEADRLAFSPELVFEIRNAEQRRELALDLLTDPDSEVQKFTLKASLKDDPDVVASYIREKLDLTHQLQSQWRNPRIAFHAWRELVEDQGVLAFQAARVPSEEASGFAYWAETLPFVVVNKKDTWARRSFSLIHELAHLMLHQSGVSDIHTSAPRSDDDEKTEIFCNQVAAATLIPRTIFLNEEAVARETDRYNNWNDETISELSKTFSVSREAIVRRLLTLGKTTPEFYGRKRSQYAREFQRQQEIAKAKRGDKGIPRNMPSETVAAIGKPLLRALIYNYHADRLSLSELSGYLGVKVRHVPGIERMIGMG